VLLHSFADRKMHDFFLERDYPPADELSRVARVLTAELQAPDDLRKKLRLDLETFERTAEKLIAQGAAVADIAGNLRSTGQSNWRSSYDSQLAFRRSQIDRIAGFAETPQCRMVALIQHFGDTNDGLRPCGHCDFCSPEHATAQTFRQPTQQEDRQLRSILRALDGAAPRATGKLHTDLALGIDRKQFDGYLNALTRAGLITLTTDTFTNAEGTVINFKRASLTHEGRTRDEADDLGVFLPSEDQSSSQPKNRGKQSRSSRKDPRSSSGLSSRPERSGVERPASLPLTPVQQKLEENLRAWRKSEAAKTGKPAFIVFGDAVLTNIVQAQPQTITELLNVSGIGQEKADRYGAAIIALCRDKNGEDRAGNDREIVARKNSNPSTDSSFRAKRQSREAEEPPHSVRSSIDAGRVPHLSDANIIAKVAPSREARPSAPAPAETFTPAQQLLDQRLRDWRTSEAERLGLPQFFVLGTSTLRNIALECPRTLTHLKKVNGISLEKAEKFGASILEICNA
jgi:ATP-dependent DNA helicase RecQ